MIEKKDYIHPTRLKDTGLEEFITRTFHYFHEEINRLRNTIYDYEEPEYIFALNERAWLGLFNNAIIKAFPESAVTLQEFVVYDDSPKFVGRGDLIVNWKDIKNEKEYYLLFEAKQYEELSKANILIESTDDFESIKEQASKYHKAEFKHYEKENFYIIPLLFGWIRKEGLLEAAQVYFEQDKTTTDSTDFCTLYHENEKGAWVYGAIYPIAKQE